MLMANPRINKAAHLGLVTQRNICGAKERNDLNEIMKNLWTCRRGHFLKYPFLTSELRTESCLPLTVLEQQLVRILVTILKLVYGTRLELEEKVWCSSTTRTLNAAPVIFDLNIPDQMRTCMSVKSAYKTPWLSLESQLRLTWGYLSLEVSTFWTCAPITGTHQNTQLKSELQVYVWWLMSVVVQWNVLSGVSPEKEVGLHADCPSICGEHTVSKIISQLLQHLVYQMKARILSSHLLLQPTECMSKVLPPTTFWLPSCMHLNWIEL